VVVAAAAVVVVVVVVVFVVFALVFGMWNCWYFGGVKVSWRTKKTLLKSQVSCTFGVEVICPPTRFIGLLPVFPLHAHFPNTTSGLKIRCAKIIFLTPVSLSCFNLSSSCWG
jgi:hypothetical protein